MNYLELLNDDRVINEYNKIDEVNPFPFNHGLRHVKNVCKIMIKLCSTLGIPEDEKEALLIAAALHDVGQAEGREEHGRKGKEFLIKNFENELKDQKYYNEILEAIENHDNPCDINNPLFTLLVQFADKMDFSKERLEFNYREKFRYYCWEIVEKVDFIYTDSLFGIDIKTANVAGFEKQFFSENFSMKIINALEVLAQKLNREVILLNNGNEMKINKMNV